MLESDLSEALEGYNEAGRMKQRKQRRDSVAESTDEQEFVKVKGSIVNQKTDGNACCDNKCIIF